MLSSALDARYMHARATRRGSNSTMLFLRQYNNNKKKFFSYDKTKLTARIIKVKEMIKETRGCIPGINPSHVGNSGSHNPT